MINIEKHALYSIFYNHGTNIPHKKSGALAGAPDLYCYSIFTIVLITPSFRDPQGTTYGCATCDLSLMGSPITRRWLE